ncbi:MAG TPA: hypothetical protein PKD72_14030 [Gemmatales bacterium]|nr:hypothetical protein [Gemmatales bacterium]
MYLEYTADIDPIWAWDPYVPSADNPWSLEKAGHLFRRAAWGATWGQLQEALMPRSMPCSTHLMLLPPSTAKPVNLLRH